jgi:autotransporter-associated beta strand protein
MRNYSYSDQSNASRMTWKVAVLSAFLIAVAQIVHAGSATWSSDPGGADPSSWFDAANWTPQTIPNSNADTATFGVDAQTDISISHRLDLSGITFDPGASAYSMTFGGANHQYTFSGTGIVNNSGVVQNFTLAPDTSGASWVYFMDGSSAGDSTAFRVGGGSATTTGFVGLLYFYGSNAGNGTFTIDGGDNNWNGGSLTISSNSTLENATVDVGGATGTGASGATCRFFTGSTAANAILIVRGGVRGHPGGLLQFNTGTLGGTPRVELFGNGTLDISPHEQPGLTIGSLEGDGLVSLGSNTLAIGSNNLRTQFGGVIQGSGAITKLGQSVLTLTGDNTYSGTTTVSRGTLAVNNTTGSGTGTGPVLVSNGSLAGAGIIAGPVTVGVGTHEATLSPGATRTNLAPLTIQSTLTLNASARYTCTLDSRRTIANQVIANGVISASSATFDARDNGNSVLSAGTVFTVISNTSSGQIAGNFANLPDGGSITVGSNTFQANYEGGDGNDLTLTVIP